MSTLSSAQKSPANSLEGQALPLTSCVNGHLQMAEAGRIQCGGGSLWIFPDPDQVPTLLVPRQRCECGGCGAGGPPRTISQCFPDDGEKAPGKRSLGPERAWGPHCAQPSQGGTERFPCVTPEVEFRCSPVGHVQSQGRATLLTTCLHPGWSGRWGPRHVHSAARPNSHHCRAMGEVSSPSSASRSQSWPLTVPRGQCHPPSSRPTV